MIRVSAITEPLYKGIAQIRKHPLTFRLVIFGPLIIAGTVTFLIALYSFVNPPFSTLMLARYVLARPVEHNWVPLHKISKHLPRAVIVAEDSKYCQHRGVDWDAVENAWQSKNSRAKPRGASTIPMQTAKNLFLWPARSYIRKAIEVPLAYTMTFFWSKRRTIEIYLNLAEWGPGIFGAEAAARYHFKKSASRLSQKEAALLAAALPNPFIRRAGRPGPKTRRQAGRIERRMKNASPWVKCLRR